MAASVPSCSRHQHGYDRTAYMSRWGIEGFFAKLKQWRRIANRYDKLALAASFSNHRRINAMHAVHQEPWPCARDSIPQLAPTFVTSTG